MAYLQGEGIAFGIATEATRGTAVEPQIWIPARSPSTIQTVVDKFTIQEAKGTGITSHGSEIATSRAEGSLEFNVRNKSIGYLLRSALGEPTSAEIPTSTGAYSHIFKKQVSDAQHPSATFALSQPGAQSYEYPLGIVQNLSINLPLDDLVNASVDLMAKVENDHAAYTPAFSTSDDHIFRNPDVTIKFADTVAGLSGATEVCLSEFSLATAVATNPRNCIGSSSPTDILSGAAEITGTIGSVFEDVATYYDVFKSGGYKAIEIKMERSDLADIGTSSQKPGITILLPKVSFESYTPDRPLEDIVNESIDFTAHYSDSDTTAMNITLYNDKADYDT